MKYKVWKLVPGHFNYQRILCKMESEEVSVLICTNFDSFANTYLIKVSCFKNFIVYQKLRLILCEHKRAWN